MLTHKCDECDSSGYAEPNGKAFKARMATIKTAAPDPTPAPDNTPPTPTPTPAKKAGFSLSDL
jgi:hypothetical protein